MKYKWTHLIAQQCKSLHWDPELSKGKDFSENMFCSLYLFDMVYHRVLKHLNLDSVPKYQPNLYSLTYPNHQRAELQAKTCIPRTIIFVMPFD